jgi:hypothetical protein
MENVMLRTAMLAAGLALAGAMLLPGAVSAAPMAPLASVSDALGSAAQKAQYYGGWRERDYYRERRWDHDGYWHRRRHCERLRRACIYKDERGEVGEGNCRRYRRACGG